MGVDDDDMPSRVSSSELAAVELVVPMPSRVASSELPVVEPVVPMPSRVASSELPVVEPVVPVVPELSRLVRSWPPSLVGVLALSARSVESASLLAEELDDPESRVARSDPEDAAPDDPESSELRSVLLELEPWFPLMALSMSWAASASRAAIDSGLNDALSLVAGLVLLVLLLPAAVAEGVAVPSVRPASICCAARDVAEVAVVMVCPPGKYTTPIAICHALNVPISRWWRRLPRGACAVHVLSRPLVNATAVFGVCA